MASSGSQLNREDYRKKKELDEQRKAGTLPPEQDEEGNMINPHNPEYISKRPWYLGESGPSLKHQNAQIKKHYLSMNEADEAIKQHGRAAVSSGQAGKLTYDAKRDRWSGYNPDDHKLTIQKYDRMSALRRKKKQERENQKFERDQKAKAEKARKLAAGAGGTKKKVGEGAAQSSEEEIQSDDSDSDSDYESDVEEDNEDFVDKDGEGRIFHGRIARQGGIGGAQMKVSTRNLRIREDTAKYLRNLNPNSAYYDPKTRSMRDNPTPHANPEDLVYAGDNFVRNNGDSNKLASTQVFAWNAYEKGSEIHVQANPSQAELLQKEFQEKKKNLKKNQKKAILEKYGGAKHLDAPPAELLLAQTENYVEYSRDGRVLKGGEKAKAKSKYEEDILENNHTAVWGSFFDTSNFSWGYHDDFSTQKNSYSTGEAGKQARLEAMKMSSAVALRDMLPAQADNPEGGKASAQNAASGTIQLYGEAEEGLELDQDKLKAALAKEELFQKSKVDDDDRKRKYNSFTSTQVTAEEMEAYRMKKTRGDDPMAKLLDSEELLPME